MCAAAFSARLSAGCFEEGALFVRLWNLQTSLMDAEAEAAQGDARAAHARAAQLSERVRRLEPLVDWEREASGEVDALKAELSSEQKANQVGEGQDV